MMLPTSPRLMRTFERLVDMVRDGDDDDDGDELREVTAGDDSDVTIPSLLEPENPHKLMYSLQIIEYLSKPAR